MEEWKPDYGEWEGGIWYMWKPQMSLFFPEILQNGWWLKNVGERNYSLWKKKHLKMSIRIGMVVMKRKPLKMKKAGDKGKTLKWAMKDIWGLCFHCSESLWQLPVLWLWNTTISNLELHRESPFCTNHSVIFGANKTTSLKLKEGKHSA